MVRDPLYWRFYALLGLSEAEERVSLAEIYAFVVDLARLLGRDQFVVSTAMAINHKYLKLVSLLKLSSALLFVAASGLFIAAKLLYVPVTLEKLVQALFTIEKRRNP